MDFKGAGLDIFYLALCWALTLTTSTLLTTIGPLSAVQVGASDVLAPFTIGAFLFGAAFSSVPSGPLFRKYGRMKGFSVGCLCQVIGCCLGCLAMSLQSHVIIFFSCFFVGLGQGLGQFYRFSAVEVAPANLKPRAITFVLTGGVLAAYLGPNTAQHTVHLMPARPYLGSYLMIGVIGILNQACCMMVRFSDSSKSAAAGLTSIKDSMQSSDSNRSGNLSENEDTINSDSLAMMIAPTNRPIMTIITEPLFVVSCAVATLAHTIMVMIMSNCTLALVDQGFTINDASLMMQLHFGCMFIPGFFTGKLIEAYGSFLVAMLGALVYACSSVIFLIGEDLWNFYLGMSLLGVAWNFSFSAGTVMLTGSYQKSEAPDVQAINDFILFTVAGIGSLISGVVFTFTSWDGLVWMVTGMMCVNIWNIKAQIEESIRLMELEEAEAEVAFLKENYEFEQDGDFDEEEVGDYVGVLTKDDDGTGSASGSGSLKKSNMWIDVEAASCSTKLNSSRSDSPMHRNHEGGIEMEVRTTTVTASSSAADTGTSTVDTGKKKLKTKAPPEITIDLVSSGRTSLYHIEPIDRVNRYSTSAMGRVTRVGTRPMINTPGSARLTATNLRMTATGNGRMSTVDSNGDKIKVPLSTMFNPVPIHDPHDEIRISVFSPI